MYTLRPVQPLKPVQPVTCLLKKKKPKKERQPQTYFMFIVFECKYHWSCLCVFLKYRCTLCPFCLVSPRSCSRRWTNWHRTAPSTSCCQRTAAARGRRSSLPWAAGCVRNWTINKTKRIALAPRLATSPLTSSLCLQLKPSSLDNASYCSIFFCFCFFVLEGERVTFLFSSQVIWGVIVKMF